jgi:DNA-binding transcriptional LysR family regulator
MTTDGPLDLDLDLLVALDALLRERQVTRAAQRLGVTQSAASQKLRRLREAFDDPLLVSGRPLMVLTPRAIALRDPLARAITELRAAVRLGAPFEPTISTWRFVLLGNDLAEVAALPPLLGLLEREAPRSSLSFERADADSIARLEQGSADLAFLPDFMVHGSLRRLPLPPEPFVVLLRRDHPARRKLDLERYLELGHLLVAPRGLPGSIVDSALEALGQKRRVVARVQHFVSAPPIVAATDLAVTLPRGVHTALANYYPVVAVPAPIELPIDRASVVWHERAHDDAGVQWLRSRIAAFFQSGRRLRPPAAR